jgi:hypothetical protein
MIKVKIDLTRKVVRKLMFEAMIFTLLLVLSVLVAIFIPIIYPVISIVRIPAILLSLFVLYELYVIYLKSITVGYILVNFRDKVASMSGESLIQKTPEEQLEQTKDVMKILFSQYQVKCQHCNSNISDDILKDLELLDEEDKS